MLKDKKTKITFHNGMTTIGGTIIEVIYEDSHLFFDFGSEYHPEIQKQPTDLQGILDEKLAPYLNNVYDPSIPLNGYVSEKDEFKNTAVFLSHVHLDHSKMINYLNPQIPVYTLEGTKSLLNTLNINNDFLFPHYKENGKHTRDIVGVKENETVYIGKIKVKVMPIDHDAYGACGLRIETPDLVIAYTGDLRLHGYRKETTLEFCKENKNCDVLIIEGVTVSFKEVNDPVEEKDLMTEEILVNQINEITANNPNKQLTFNYYISNIERIYNIIKTNPRKVVLNAYSAYVLKEATGYQPYYYQLDDTAYGLDERYKIDFDTLLQDESKYFWQIDGKAIDHIEELKEGGIYIHSNASPMVESDPTYAPFIQRFEDKNIEFLKLACSGHAHPQDLMRIINLVQPKLLVPIHSFHPERLWNEWGDRLLPAKKQTI